MDTKTEVTTTQSYHLNMRRRQNLASKRFSVWLISGLYLFYFYCNDTHGVTSALSTNSKVSKKTKPKPKQRKRVKVAQGSTPEQIQTWRVFGVEVNPDDEFEDSNVRCRSTNNVGKQSSFEYIYASDALMKSLSRRLKVEQSSTSKDNGCHQVHLPEHVRDARVVRRSLDARKSRRRGSSNNDPKFNYVVDIDVESGKFARKLKEQSGRMELLKSNAKLAKENSDSIPVSSAKTKKAKVIIVGAGPAGLFCALLLARSGNVETVLLERGQAVESRGKDIGALIRRKEMNPDSNFAFGEGGAGTWSDGKLTTRIGRNSDQVRYVLQTFVEYGAPEKILVDGAPHLGTDNLVK